MEVDLRVDVEVDVERVVPIMPINDEASARAYYLDGLGFELLFAHRHEPGFPVHMGVRRGELVLHLSEHAKPGETADIYLFVADLADWHERVLAAGLPVREPPTPKPWGNTEMVLVDPADSTLRFSQLDTHPPAGADEQS